MASGVMFYKYHQSQNTEQARQKKLVASLSQTIDLPDGTPTIVTVSDKDKLTNKTLADRVQNQDLLVIYGSTKRIIVYRPSTKKVIDMFSFATTAATTEQQSTQSGSTTTTAPTTKKP